MANPPETTRNPTISVRSASESDVDFIVESNAAMARETENRELDRETLNAGVSAVFADPGRGFYLIAEAGGDRGGCLLITTEWSDWRNGPIWWIQSVYVRPPWRGRKLYSHLHRSVLERAAEVGNVREVRLYVDRDNDHARNVYLKMGMTVSRYDLMEQEV